MSYDGNGSGESEGMVVGVPRSCGGRGVCRPEGVHGVKVKSIWVSKLLCW